jgi:hypothetical protein
MLTTPTGSFTEDGAMLARWGLSGLGSFEGVMEAHGDVIPQKAASSTEEARV